MAGSRTTRISPYAAEPGSARSLLVDPDWLEDHLDDPRVRVVQVEVSAMAYDQGHLPGAVLWNVYTDLRRPDYQLVDPPAVEQLVRRSGIDPSTVVVFSGYAPALGLWLLDALGHRHLGVLDCSQAEWQAEGRPLTNGRPAPMETGYRLPATDPALRARREDVRAAIEDPGTTILDVRSELEYRGERFWPSGGQQAGGRAGHIPVAVHVPIDEVTDERGRFRGTAELARIFAVLDPTGPSRLITYCTIGARAATAWFVLTHLLGRSDVRVYDGSWAEWGLDPTSPVEPT